MGFPESVKASVRRKSHMQCCLCKSLGVEIHHIVPQSDGGPDSEENAAPLCPSCHEIYGANPTKRKMVTEARDLWYEICATRYAPDVERVDRLIDLLEGATSAFTGFQEYVRQLTKQPVVTEVPTAYAGAEGIETSVRVALRDSKPSSSDESNPSETIEDNGDAEDEDFDQNPRTEIEILEALEKLFDQIWYNRHWNLRIAIEQGREEISPGVWEVALAAAARVEDKYMDDPEALGPWDDFEWGMLNGKMSALRWVLGDDWDFLDT